MSSLVHEIASARGDLRFGEPRVVDAQGHRGRAPRVPARVGETSSPSDPLDDGRGARRAARAARTRAWRRRELAGLVCRRRCEPTRFMRGVRRPERGRRCDRRTAGRDAPRPSCAASNSPLARATASAATRSMHGIVGLLVRGALEPPGRQVTEDEGDRGRDEEASGPRSSSRTTRPRPSPRRPRARSPYSRPRARRGRRE